MHVLERIPMATMGRRSLYRVGLVIDNVARVSHFRHALLKPCEVHVDEWIFECLPASRES